jgi:hypothetical protein
MTTHAHKTSLAHTDITRCLVTKDSILNLPRLCQGATPTKCPAPYELYCVAIGEPFIGPHSQLVALHKLADISIDVQGSGVFRSNDGGHWCPMCTLWLLGLVRASARYRASKSLLAHSPCPDPVHNRLSTWWLRN